MAARHGFSGFTQRVKPMRMSAWIQALARIIQSEIDSRPAANHSPYKTPKNRR